MTSHSKQLQLTPTMELPLPTTTSKPQPTLVEQLYDVHRRVTSLKEDATFLWWINMTMKIKQGKQGEVEAVAKRALGLVTELETIFKS